MYFRKSNICSHKLDVQEANISVSQFYRIGSYFFGCSFANTWDPCSRTMGCGDGSVASKNTHQAVRDHCRKEKVDDQVPRSRARSEIQSTNANTQSKRDEKLMNFLMWITLSQAQNLLNSKFSCTFLKTMRL